MNSTRETTAGRHTMSWIGGLLLGVIVIAAVVVLLRGGRRTDADPPMPSTPATTNTPASMAAGQPSFSKLVGKWLRPDGGYVLDIRLVASNGKMDAAYSNPSPINVSRAEASRDGVILKVFVELRDVNYPGCTYTLRYNPEKDSMEGVYYQAALEESYDVAFVRMPSEAQ